jgi:protein-L-isoaspartate(D-aspartate) O-methyltransferase
MDSDRAAFLRAQMVDRQLRDRGIADERVLAAMGRLPREHFLPADIAASAYADAALPIASGQSVSQPYIVAMMTELIEPHAGMRVLEIGTGSGYQAAVLAAIGCTVLTIERHVELADAAGARIGDPVLASEWPDLAGRIRIEVADGSRGWPSEAPFEGILVTAAAPQIPPSLLDQLADGGRLVMPVGSMGGQEMTLVRRVGSSFSRHVFGGCMFVPLIGEEGYAQEVDARHRWPWRARPDR